ncbi:GNAT family N-acetyltransferase [Sphingomonas hengshuiensis]|uniref:GNAT family acetyltransferase n=1 Tax=Sphingomonas hengshuiensis TaxID=1609977 RepID=A0A7U4J8J8_9SPHN|nr:GNAT family N-acetyltransferase [Sphingomonas hengshuiensis]AJP72240.1 GNAT family acetyltransferase [Sphingomonas hengshuiensis]
MTNRAHPLDRPAWAALHTRQAGLAQGEGAALRFDPGYAIFAAVGDHAPHSLDALGALVRATGPAIVMQRDALPPVPGTRVESARAGVQMVAEALAPAAAPLEPLALGDADAPEMFALAMLTRPGPFFANTHRLGSFIGVREGGRLVAMAGERLRLEGYGEVSAVCTHPDFRGRGLAGALMRVVAGRMLARGEQPFLHAYADNPGAIALYESLGFRLRCGVVVTVLAPE